MDRRCRSPIQRLRYVVRGSEMRHCGQQTDQRSIVVLNHDGAARTRVADAARSGKARARFRRVRFVPRIDGRNRIAGGMLIRYALSQRICRNASHSGRHGAVRIERQRAVAIGGERWGSDEKSRHGRGGCGEMFRHAQSVPARRAKNVRALQAG